MIEKEEMYAELSELADEQDLGSCAFGVWVQVPHSALLIFEKSSCIDEHMKRRETEHRQFWFRAVFRTFEIIIFPPLAQTKPLPHKQERLYENRRLSEAPLKPPLYPSHTAPSARSAS